MAPASIFSCRCCKGRSGTAAGRFRTLGFWIWWFPALVSAPIVSAQDLPVEESLQIASDALQRLDSLAIQCQPAIVNNESSDACRRFLSAMHGELFLRYSGECDAVRNWREATSVQHLESGIDAGNSGALLELFMRAEYVCGHSALEKRGGAIVPVFRHFDGRPRESQSLLNMLRDMEFQQRDQSLRQETQRISDDLRENQRRMTDDIHQRQQQELLRQEMQRQQLNEPWRH
jgi:hypothetical protein